MNRMRQMGIKFQHILIGFFSIIMPLFIYFFLLESFPLYSIQNDISYNLTTLFNNNEVKNRVTNDSTVMTYIYNAPESIKDNRYDYHWEILRTALDKTTVKYGPYRMEKAELMGEKRQIHELKSATNKLTVMYLGVKPDFEKNLLPVRIPVDKNLGGYCIFLICKEDQKKFNAVRSLNDLRKFKIGQGSDWIDVDILKANKFNVITGANYEGLFKMLVNDRFDAFSRSAVEILDEYDTRKMELSDMKIEDSLLLYYPLPMYFWFSKNEPGKFLAKRAEEGMQMMIKDGTYDRIFLKYHGNKAKLLNLKNRRIFRIANPFLGPETPFENKKLWYNPID